MRRVLLVGGVSLLCAVLAGARPVAAGELFTSIDLDYSYTQEHIGGDVNAGTTFNQKYEIRYQTSLSTAYDFLGAVRLELQDAWYTDEAGTSQVAPTLEMQVKGSQAAAKLTYETTISTTEAYRESGEVTSHSSALSLDLELTPEIWPEMKLSFQRQRDYQAFAADSTSTTVEFQARKDIYDLRLEFNLSRGEDEQILPGRSSSSNTEWSARATYKEELWGGTEFELAYEINESYTEERTREVFSSETEAYSQNFKTRLRKSLDFAPRIRLDLSWEYEFEQDLLALDFDYKFKNNYVLQLRWDFNDWLKLIGEARRETDHTEATVGKDDEESLTDTLKAGFDLDVISWLRFAGKAEFTWGSAVAALTGGSVDLDNKEKYELVAKNVWSDFWDLTLNATSDVARLDGWVTSRASKLKADLKLKWENLLVSPSYEVGRDSAWDWGFEDPTTQQRTEDARIRFEYRASLSDMIAASFSHEYSVKVAEVLDGVLDYERTLQFNETTGFLVAIDELFRDLDLKGSIDRTASDTEDDTDPEVVDVAYALDVAWRLDELALVSSFKYNDKGAAFDDMSFNVKVGWRYESLELTGEYQFDKIYAERTEENRRLNLKLNYRF
jgi:hypothetical protein